MNTKKINHGIIITAILVAIFVAAALTPVKANTKADAPKGTINLAKVDFESRTLPAGSKVIADTQVPLAAAPLTNMNADSPVWLIVMTIGAVFTGIVIFEKRKTWL